jgi:hypothetical protein
MADTQPQIKFVEHFAPSLKTGVYEVAVKTDFTGSNPQLPATFGEKKEWVFVAGERFFIKPEDINSLYPPINGTGFFNETLPHIVFRRGGLPWERELEAPGSTADASGPRASWLALFLFDEDDPAPTPKRVSIKNLEAAGIPKGTWFPTDFQVEPDEDPNALCTVIDLPKATFEAIKPSRGDLQYLAHAREVDVRHKPGYDKDKDNSEHEYSVVIGNRLPRADKETVVHLVSLEQYRPILDGEVPATHHTVRLVSLKTWRFSCQDSGGSFQDHVEALSGIDTTAASPENPAMLHFPYPAVGTNLVGNYLRRGYVPMEHQFRQGLKSISWFRGPLAPDVVNPVLTGTFPSADALLRYDPNFGYYDVSYAAAWQLGQLLGLRNKSFAKSLYFWKQQTSLDARKKLERELLSRELPILKPLGEDGKMPLPDFDQLNLSVDNLNAPGAAIARQEAGQLTQGQAPNQFAPGMTNEWVKVISKFTEQLRALRGVPFNYLVPDVKMLPRESLRFFHIDPNWITALIDGAFNIGDLIRTDEVRRSSLKSAVTNAAPQYSGFLLRSRLLRTWPGLEARMFSGDTQLDIVRYERLSEEVILCIVAGNMDKLELREPPEALHFGVSEPTAGDGGILFMKDLRSLTGTDLDIQINGDARPNGVIDMVALAASIESAGTATVFGDKFTTADFGFVMVEPVSSVIITVVKLIPPLSA